jgi:hypothetical protein
MVWQFNSRQPKDTTTTNGTPDDGAPEPTPAEWEQWRDSLRAMNMPDTEI